MLIIITFLRNILAVSSAACKTKIFPSYCMSMPFALVLHKLVFVPDDVSSALIIACHDKKIGNAFMDQTANVNSLIRTVCSFR